MCEPWLRDFLLHSNPNIVCTVGRHLRFIDHIDLNEISKVLQSVTDNDTVVKACFKRSDVRHELQAERKHGSVVLLKKYLFVYGRSDPYVAKIEVILMVLDYEIRSPDVILRSDTDICSSMECEELVNKLNGNLFPVSTLLHQPLMDSIQLNSNTTGGNSVSCYNSERWWIRKYPVLTGINFAKFYDFQMDCELSRSCQEDTDLHRMANENKEQSVAGENLFLKKACLVNEQDSCCQTESFGKLEIELESVFQLVRKATKAVKASSKTSSFPNISKDLINAERNKIPQSASLLFIESDARIEESKTKLIVTEAAPNSDLPFRLDNNTRSVDASAMESNTGISHVMDLTSQTNSEGDKYMNNQGGFGEYHNYVDVSPSLYIYPKCTSLEINCKKLLDVIGCRELFQPLTKYENVAAILCGSSKNSNAEKCIKPLLNDFMHEYKLGNMDYKFGGNIFRQVIMPTISPLQALK